MQNASPPLDPRTVESELRCLSNQLDRKQCGLTISPFVGWKETYDEGSQNELMIGEIGDILIRGGSPNNPNFGRESANRSARIDHISFGITPWDGEEVKADLEKRGLRSRVDTSTPDDIHVAAFKSYHTTTPGGYDLQISYVTSANRLTLPNAVRTEGIGWPIVSA